MEWPQNLLDVFEDPMLKDVKPKPKAPTADDRKVQKLQEIAAWIADNGREPQRDAKQLKERLMCTALAALRREADTLKPYDTTNIL